MNTSPIIVFSEGITGRRWNQAGIDIRTALVAFVLTPNARARNSMSFTFRSNSV
jgi:hypothetical protein